MSCRDWFLNYCCTYTKICCFKQVYSIVVRTIYRIHWNSACTSLFRIRYLSVLTCNCTHKLYYWENKSLCLSEEMYLSSHKWIHSTTIYYLQRLHMVVCVSAKDRLYRVHTWDVIIVSSTHRSRQHLITLIPPLSNHFLWLPTKTKNFSFSCRPCNAKQESGIDYGSFLCNMSVDRSASVYLRLYYFDASCWCSDRTASMQVKVKSVMCHYNNRSMNDHAALLHAAVEIWSSVDNNRVITRQRFCLVGNVDAVVGSACCCQRTFGLMTPHVCAVPTHVFIVVNSRWYSSLVLLPT